MINTRLPQILMKYIIHCHSAVVDTGRVAMVSAEPPLKISRFATAVYAALAR